MLKLWGRANSINVQKALYCIEELALTYARIDAGRGYGVTFKLVEAKFPLTALRYIFITHHHSDHNLEAGPLSYNAWALGLKTPVDIYGPDGVDALIDGFFAGSKFDIERRIVDEGPPRSAQARHHACL